MIQQTFQIKIEILHTFASTKNIIPNTKITSNNFILASFGAVTNPLGSILSGILAEVLGRKRSIQISSLPFIIGWILIAFGRNIGWLYSGRLITGIAGGISN